MVRRGGYTGGTIRVQGLNALVRDFNRVASGLKADLQRELQDVAEIVSDEAKDIVQQEGLVDSGRLLKGIRPRVRGTTAIVENRAKSPRPKTARARTRGNYPYPGIYEYGRAGGKRRPFLVPALDNKQEDVVEALEDMLDRLTSRNGFGRGGIL